MLTMLNKLPVSSPKASRRGFILGSAAIAGGFAVGFAPSLRAEDQQSLSPNPFGAYVTITEDGKVVIFSSQFDMGQGAYMGLATLLNEELDASWEQIEVTGAFGNPKLYGNIAWGGAFQGSGGSTSMTTSWERYRTAGAAARELLIQAAADKLGVSADELKAENGQVISTDGKALSYGELAPLAAGLSVPEKIALKDRSEWKYIGDESLRRYDSKSKTDGTHEFTIDVKLPGMLTAIMIHPPTFGATIKSFNAEEAKEQPGIVDVVATSRGLAIVGKTTWDAMKGVDLVSVEWDETNAELRGSEEILAGYRKRASEAPELTARHDGDADAAFEKAATIIEETYEFPFLAHAAMEPLNAVVWKNADGKLEIWGGHQIPDVYQAAAAQIAEMDPADVILHVMKTGGGFGRRAVPDADIISEAVMVAKSLNFMAPVKVQWTRENDMKGGRYRPAYIHSMRAGLDENGKIIAWEDHIVGQSILAATPFQVMIQNGIDPTTVEGSANLPYTIENLKVAISTSDVKVPVLWWRAVGSTHNAYATECFLDKIAAETGADPVELRLSLLEQHPRHAEVLKQAVAASGYGKELPDGHYHGVAVHESFQSFVAQVAEISMEDGWPKVHKVTCAVDCGTVINPDVVKAQIEGGIGFGLGSILREEITLSNGAVDQDNYSTYEPLRIDEMPEIEVVIIPSTENPTGVGEPGVPPAGPAVANAVRNATGKIINQLPFTRGASA